MAQSFNTVVLMGRLVKDPVSRDTAKGKVVSYTLAVDKGYGKEGANFFDCASWGKTGELAEKYLKKGSLILVRGKLSQQTWEKNGVKQSKISVLVDEMTSVGGGAKKTVSQTQVVQEAFGMPTDAELEEIKVEEIPF